MTGVPPRTEGHAYQLRILNDDTLVATYSGRRALVGGVEQFTPSSGVFVSTDNGATWADRTATNMRWYTKGVEIDPTDPTQNTWYAAVANGWSGTGNDLGDLYRTESGSGKSCCRRFAAMSVSAAPSGTVCL